MSHLTEKTQEFLSLPREERALACMREIFLMHPTAMAAELSAMRLVSLPRCTSNPGMSLIAHPGLGKSLLGQRWQTQSCKPGSTWGGKVIFIDLVQNQANLNIMKLFLAEVGRKFSKRPLTLSYRDIALAQRLIKENNVRAVFIDEIPLLRQALSEKRLNGEYGALKGLSGPDWQLNVILSGTPDGLKEVFDGDATLMTRFNLRKARLSEWENDYEGESFVKGYLCYMPLLQQSNVDNHLLKNLFDYAQSTTTENHEQVVYRSRRAIADILREACRMVVESGQEYINAESILNAWGCMQGTNKALEILEVRPMPNPGATL
ncbi:hypothetical protein PS918_02759 [Pseudomonas fluorescens]|uniref:AAA+ ATPase domain-containing protein n=1 Tax=Pseudomonas fluorescens TaxID=294 RepID=A0A5E7SIK5_PSEFL|nr:TniB family NTP-binding protein [Pseudomonas fluorescens]VVP85750.1 hypothetical protein PS918_02759 [Pseudomonas fluorescens]